MRLYISVEHTLQELISKQLSIPYAYKLISRRKLQPDHREQVEFIKTALRIYRGLQKLQSI